MTHKTNVPENRVMYVMSWTEIELGWGERPDGYSVHPSPEKFKEYADRLERKRIQEGWDEFSVPDWKQPKRIYIEPGSEIEKCIEALSEGEIKASSNGTLRLMRSEKLARAISEHLRQT